jgi:hypothetical protein
MRSVHSFTTTAAAVALFVFGAQAYAQDSVLQFSQRPADTARAAPGRALTAPSAAAPAGVVQGYLRSRGASAAAVAGLRQTDAHGAAGGITHIRMEQQVEGLTVYGSYVKAAVNTRGELVHVTDKLAPAGALTPAAIREQQALAVAVQRLHPDAQVAPVAGARSGNTLTFRGGAFFHRDPQVTRVAVPMNDGTLAVGYLVETWTKKTNLLHHTLVGGDGRVLAVQKRTATDAYNVFIEDPLKGSQTTVNGPAPGGTPSPAGWLASGGQANVNITGNNVHGYLDSNANNQPDAGGTAVADGNFLTAVNLTQAPTTTGNKAVSVQNLFYLNNVVHDILYGKGFTEAAGNFQEDNFGRGGADGDSVNAEAQDGAGTDNANFATPPDGKNPRMQMFLWTGNGPTHEVVVNSPPGSGPYTARAAEWSTFTTTGLTGNVVLVNDGVGTATDGCEAFTQNLRGLIALVDRGTCTFAIKAINAQRAGAIGMVVANNVGGPPIVMGGSDVGGVRIPSMMISNTDGAVLRKLMNPNVTMHMLPVQPLQIDASLDADVVFHEYGHGLTWRMIGGMDGPLAGAIGEGASDTLAMMINGDDRIGEYSTSNPLGIRRAPYSGYPRTYKDVTGEEVHNDGEIYAAAMWRLIELFDANREQLFSYWVDGMNYTPPTPAYEDMRNGMLQAIANSTGSTTDCGLVWQAFAQFGIGQGAKGVVTTKGQAKGTVTITQSLVNPGDTCSTD